MIESTLKEYVDKVGTQYRAAKIWGYLCSCLLNHCKIIRLFCLNYHDENLNVIQKLVRKWGKR